MAFLESCSEKAAGLAGGLVWWMVGGDKAEPLVMAAVASVGLAALVGEVLRLPGPESARRLKKIQGQVRASVADWQRREGVPESALASAEAALDRSLALCFIDRERLAESAVSAHGFPRKASELVLEQLARHEPIFREPVDGDIARRFATEVVVAALEAAVQDEDYFRKLEPHLLLSIARALGQLQPVPQLVAETHHAVQQIASRLPTKAAEPRLRHQLPRQLDRLVGRDEQRRRIVQRLAQAGQAGDAPGALCIIEGMPGLGKSALALAVAADLAQAFPDFHFWFALKAHSQKPLTPELARDQVLSQLVPGGKLTANEDERWSMLSAAYFGDDGSPLHGVVVIDDCGSEQVLKALLPPTAVPVIVTARRAMALGWSEPLAELDIDSARELVVAIHPALGNLDGLEQLLSASPRLPLVLRAVAAGLKKGRQGEAGVRRMTEEIRRRPLAATGDLEAPDGVRAVLATSIEPLSEEQRRVWSALAIMTTDFDLEAAMAVANCPAAAIDELIERYLLETDPESGRCRWHDLMRVLAGELSNAALVRESRIRHARHFTALARSIAKPFLNPLGELEAARRTLDREWGHVAAVLEFAASPEAATGALRELVMALTPFQLRYRLAWPEVERFWQSALGVFKAANDAPATARCLWGLGDAALMQDLYEPAAFHLRQAMEHLAQAAEPVVAAWLHYTLADVLRQSTDDVVVPRDEAQRAKSLFSSVGHDKGVADCDQLIGQIEYESDASADGEPHLSRALAQFEQQHDGAAVGSVLAVQGRVCHETGRPEEAIALSRRALELATAHGDVVAELNALATLGLALTQTGEWSEAAEALAQCEAKARRHGNRAALAWAWYGQATLAQAEDRLDEALRILQSLQPLAGQISSNWAGEVLLTRAEVLVGLSRATEAWDLVAGAGLTHPHAQERSRMVRVLARLEQSDAEAARPELAHLTTSTLGVVHRESVAHAVARLARLDHDQGRAEAAFEGLARAAAMYDEAGTARDRVNVRWQLANLLLQHDRTEQARAAFESVHRTGVETGLPVAAANARAALARLDVAAGDHDAAEQGFSAAVEAFLGVERPAFAVRALLDEFGTWWNAGEQDRAWAAARAARRLARRHALADEGAAACEHSAERCAKSGRWRLVLPLLHRACALRAERSDRRAEVATLTLLAEAAYAVGDDAGARHAAERALVLSDDGGSVEERCSALLWLARSVSTDDRVQARHHLQEAARLAAGAHLPRIEASALNDLALVSLEEGDAAHAMELASLARRHLEPEDRLGQAWVTLTETRVRMFQGGLETVPQQVDEVFAAATAGDDYRLQAHVHSVLAELAARRADPKLQALHAEQVLTLRERHGPPRGLPWGHLLSHHAQAQLDAPACTPAACEHAVALARIAALARQVRSWGAEIAALVGQARAEAAGGQAAHAARCLDEALNLARRHRSPMDEMEVLFALGQDTQAREIQRRVGCERNPLFCWPS